MSSLGYISLIFLTLYFLAAELKAVSQLFALPHFSASAEHILGYLIACYLNFKKTMAQSCVWDATLTQGREEGSAVIKQLMLLER